MQGRRNSGCASCEDKILGHGDIPAEPKLSAVCLIDGGGTSRGSQGGIVRDGEHPLIYQSRSRVGVPSGQTKGAGSGFGQSPRAGDGPVDGLVGGIADREIRRAFDDDVGARGAGQGADGHRSGGVRTGDLHGLAIGQADRLGIGAGVDDDGASGRNRGEGLGQGREGVDLENRSLAAGSAKVSVTDRLAGVLGEAVVHIDHGGRGRLDQDDIIAVPAIVVDAVVDAADGDRAAIRQAGEGAGGRIHQIIGDQRIDVVLSGRNKAEGGQIQRCSGAESHRAGDVDDVVADSGGGAGIGADLQLHRATGEGEIPGDIHEVGEVVTTDLQVASSLRQVDSKVVHVLEPAAGKVEDFRSGAIDDVDSAEIECPACKVYRGSAATHQLGEIQRAGHLNSATVQR